MQTKLFISISLIAFLFAANTVHAALLYPLNDLKAIEAPISREELTRIIVKNDRILNVFGLGNEYVLEADEAQGQVFIRPRYSNNSKPIHLTLTTEHGHTQDLRLTPQDQVPEALILEAMDQENQISKNNQDYSRDEIETLLQVCHEGRIPLGYKRVPLKLQTLKEGPYLIRELKGQKLRCLTYEIQNRFQKPLILSEPEFALTLKETEVVAIYMPKKTINPKERTLVHVVARAH
ncbi:MAG: hypothetical protein BGO67_09810 [Alphaproteobacteria bacterium 41-28]|nr:MAG: hypothetical protein BGO67_09810 [Alphaproteobacteria bacterium 41-28]